MTPTAHVVALVRTAMLEEFWHGYSLEAVEDLDLALDALDEQVYAELRCHGSKESQVAFVERLFQRVVAKLDETCSQVAINATPGILAPEVWSVLNAWLNDWSDIFEARF